MADGWPGVVERTPGDLGTVRDISRYPWAFKCPRPHCYLAVAVYTRDEALRVESDHKCPALGGTLHISWWSQMTLLEEMWKELDRALDEYYDAPGEMKDPKQHYMRGLSYAIALFMQPHFRTTTDIAHEAVRRRTARLNGDESYQTVGLNERRLEMPPSLREITKPATPAPQPPKTFTPQEIATIKQSAAVMPLADIARLYGVAEAVIRKAIA
jgi:hypothetical protein